MVSKVQLFSSHFQVSPGSLIQKYKKMSQYSIYMSLYRIRYNKELFFDDDLSNAIRKASKKFGNIVKRYYSKNIEIAGFPSTLEQICLEFVE